VTRRRRRRCKKRLNNLKDMRGYSHLKEEALDRTIWRNPFRRGVGPVVRQITERMMNEFKGDQFMAVEIIAINDKHMIFRTVGRIEP
jgi:hypothetical protein